MKAKYIIKTILALMVVFSATSCAEWGELPDGFSFDKMAYQQPEPEPEPEPDPNPTPVKPTERGQIIETGAVDLGLSVKWAACNLGADYCYEEGDKYNFGNDEVNCPEQIGGTQYDHARAVLGGKWSTPSITQWEEVNRYCLIESSTYRGKRGLIITGPSKKAIFLPNNAPSSWNHDGYYWSSTLNLSNNRGFMIFFYSSSSYINFDDLSRDTMLGIRPIMLN